MTIGNNTAAELRSIVERVERLEEQKAEIADGIKDVFAEGKSMGFDVKILKKVISQRRIDPAVRREQRDLLDTYMHALGMDEGEDLV